MLLSLLVYSITGLILFLLGWHVNKRECESLLLTGKKLPFYSWEILLSLLLFAVVAGARYHTGYDHAMYLEQYQHLQANGEFSRHNFEYGFEWISKIFAWCHIHYFFYFAFCQPIMYVLPYSSCAEPHADENLPSILLASTCSTVFPVVSTLNERTQVSPVIL